MSYMKQPCKHCPYRKDVKPFLTPERGEEIAYITQNPYNSFHCHKTTVSDEEFGGEGDEMVATNDSKMCAGFLTLMANECGEEEMPEGFNPAYDVCYTDAFDMVQAYENPDDFEEPKKKKKKKK